MSTERSSNRPILSASWRREGSECKMALSACILVIDDDESVLELITDVLATEYDVEAVTDPFAGLARLEREHFDALIVDLGMPELDGIELIRRVRSRPATHALPILAISAFDQLRERLSTVDVDVVISKPFSLPRLEQAVAQLVHQSPAGAAKH